MILYVYIPTSNIIYYTCMHIYMYILCLCIPKYTSIFVQSVC